MREHMSDVKRIELFVSQVQQTEDVDVVLIPSAKTAKIVKSENLIFTVSFK